MALDTISALDTKGIAGDFNGFLDAQGLGSMNAASAARLRKGVEVSPMDEILALNGFDMEALFRKVLPEPSPLLAAVAAPLDVIPELGPGPSALQQLQVQRLERQSAASQRQEAIRQGQERLASQRAEQDRVADMVGGLGLSFQEQKSLQFMLRSGSEPATGQLSTEMQALLNSSGARSLSNLILQLAKVKLIMTEAGLRKDSNAASVLTSVMALLRTGDSNYAVQRLERAPNLALIPTESDSTWKQASTQRVVRLYNTQTSRHLVSSSQTEIDALTGQSGWRNEGLIYNSPADGSDVLFRFLVATDGRHFYTANKTERDLIISNPQLSHFIFEGMSHRVYYHQPIQTTQSAEGLTPVIRFLNSGSGTHLFVSSIIEQNALLASGNWINEGVAWYGT